MQKTLAILAVVLTFVLGAVAGSWLRGLRPAPEPDIQRDTVWMRDTIKLPAPKPKTVKVRDTLFVPVPDTLLVHHHDTTYVPVPISQTYYNEKEYQAWVSGYRAQLDSIHVVQSTAIVEVPVYKTRTKHWSVTIGPQLGYGFTPKGWQPYAGIGVTAGYSF